MNFGYAAVALAIVAAPSIAIAAQEATPGQVSLFFDWDSTALTPEATQNLDRVVLATRLPGFDRIEVIGHTDRTHSPATALRLSQRMAESARDYLVARGVPADRIKVRAFGWARMRVVTSGGVRELVNRRVDVVIHWTPRR